MESKKLYELKLSYGERNACLSTPEDISFTELIEKAASRFKLSQAIILECYDPDRLSSGPCWMEVGEEDMYRLPHWTQLRLRVCSDPSITSPAPASNGSGVQASEPVQSASDHANTNSTRTPADGDSANIPADEDASSDSDHELVPYCTEPLWTHSDDTDSTEEIERPQGTAGAFVQKTKIWNGRDKLSVYFINPSYQQKGKYPLTVEAVLAWAGYWNNALVPAIPKFGRTDMREEADIRVKCGDGRCWSKVGTDAKLVTDKNAPTMLLSLKDHTPKFQQYLVIHEFGHSLGLLHEHQRWDFWDEMSSLLDVDKMKSDLGMSTVDFKVDILQKDVPDGETTEYDPDSIMHYWFDKKWLKNKKHRKLAGVLSDKTLSQGQVKFLEGIHKRHHSVTSGPSQQDFCFLQKCYGPEPSPGMQAGAPPIATVAAAMTGPMTTQCGPAHSEPEGEYNREIDTIAREVGLNPASLNKRFADKHCLSVSKKLVNWRSYAPFLHLSELEIVDIERKYSVGCLPHNKPQAMLKRWNELCYVGVKGHYRYLLGVIMKVDENHQLVENICRSLK